MCCARAPAGVGIDEMMRVALMIGALPQWQPLLCINLIFKLFAAILNSWVWQVNHEEEEGVCGVYVTLHIPTLFTSPTQ